MFQYINKIINIYYIYIYTERVLKMAKKVSEKTTDDLASWTVEELVNHRTLCSEEVDRMKVANQTLKSKINSNEAQIKLYNATVRKISNHLQGRKIKTLEDELRVKHGSHLTDKQHAKVWSKAWEDGHYAGDSEITNHYIDLAEMFAD